MKHSIEIGVAILACALEILAIEQAQAADLGMKDTPSVPTAATAQSDPVNWSGIYIGGQVGYGNANHNVSGQSYECELDGQKNHTCYTSVPDNGAAYVAVPGGNSFVDGFDSHGAFAGLRLGADMQRENWLFGIFGDYNFSQAEMTVGAGPDDVGFRGSIKDGDSWIAAARAGYLFGDDRRALLYVLGGYGQQDVNYHGGFGGQTGAFDKGVTFSGFVAGAGAEYALTKTVFLGLEYQHFFGGTENIFDNRGEKNCAIAIDDKMQSDKVMGRISFKIGPGLINY